MKRICFAALLLFSAVCLKAQSLTDCENVVKETVNAINGYSVETLHRYLASDFECSGQKGDVADQVLNAIIGMLAQSNDRIEKYEKISDERNGDMLTLDYTFIYSKHAKSRTTFCVRQG